MPEICHLSKAPVTEAVVDFQANASLHWDPAFAHKELVQRWSDHPEVQELRPVEFKFSVSSGASQPPQMNMHEVEGLTFSSETSILQARRDGFSFIKRPPYSEWTSLKTDALTRWEDYHAVLKPSSLHAMGVRFSNLLVFPADGFKLSRCLATPPIPPPNLGWGFRHFLQQAHYAPPDSSCIVQTTVTRAFTADPVNQVAIALDIQVTLSDSVLVAKRGVESVLMEMHDLKNKAFFNLLTEEAIQFYM